MGKPRQDDQIDSDPTSLASEILHKTPRLFLNIGRKLQRRISRKRIAVKNPSSPDGAPAKKYDVKFIFEYLYIRDAKIILIGRFAR